MARKFAQFKLAMWGDDEFRDLSPAEQHLYFTLTTSPSLDHCGVGDWRPGRVSALARGWTVEQVLTTAAGLIERLYVVTDESTEEVLVRSFVRHDELMKQPKMAVAVCRAHDSVASGQLRGVIVHELRRLREEFPELSCWGIEKVSETLAKASVDPSTYPLGKGIATLADRRAERGAQQLTPTPATLTLHQPDSLRESAAPIASPAPSEITAQTITAAWVDSVQQGTGTAPSKSQIGQVAKTAKELLTKNDPQRVLAAAQAAGAGGYTTIDRELTVAAGRGSAGGRAQRRDPKTGRAVDW